jgi:hypothetical protein
MATTTINVVRNSSKLVPLFFVCCSLFFVLCIKCPSKIMPHLEMCVVPCCTDYCPFVVVQTVKYALYGLHKTVVPFPRNICTKFVVRPSRNPYGTTLTLSNTLLDFYATSLPWESCYYSSNFSLFLKLDLSLALSCSLNKNG